MNMINTLSEPERFFLVEWCSLKSGYHVSCYEKMNDEELQKEYTKLSGEVF